jgi:hypothetical protein
MASERLKKFKEEPLVDQGIPHPYREIVKELRTIRAQLEEIKAKLPIAIPLAPPVVVRPGAPPVVKIPAIQLSKEEFREIYEEALEKYEALRLADDLHVETIDLGVDRSTAANIQEFPKLAGIALTIFRCTGTADIYLNKKDDYHKLTFDAITYPQTYLLDWFRLKTIFIGNAGQSGKTAVLVAWKRLS